MGNQRRRGMRATAGGTTWRHRRGAPPSSHEPGQPPPRPHVAPPRPVPPTPRPRPLSAPGATEARHERTSTQGRTQFVVCGRDSPTPEPFGERGLPALQARGPAAAGRGPFRAVSPARAICDTAPESSPRERGTRMGNAHRSLRESVGFRVAPAPLWSRPPSFAPAPGRRSSWRGRHGRLAQKAAPQAGAAP